MKNRVKMNIRAVLAHIALFLCVCSVQPQNSNSTIRGQVLDPTGALVPNAHVVVVNEQTNVVAYDGQSDTAGSFVASQVIPGQYRVTVTAAGFKETVVNDLVATVAQVSAVNVNLQVGANSAEVITVTSKGEQLDRSTSNISTLISPEEVSNLPLSLRAPENLLVFVPGVTTTRSVTGDTTQANTSQLSINGSRTLNTEVLLNGVSLIIASTGGLLSLPSPDAIDELRFLTSTAPAEYGRTSGAVLAANSLSGTNTYHGNAYILMRNEALDANTFFNKLSNSVNNAQPNLPNGNENPAFKKRPRDRYFQFGGSFGGPLVIPHVYDGHDKTFFFVNYDRTRLKSATTVNNTVPGNISSGGVLDIRQRSGDFSGSTNLIYQPGTAIPYGPGAANKLPALDPAAAKIIALLPLPNSVGTAGPAGSGQTINNFSYQDITQLDYLRFVARVDEQLTKKDRLSFNFYKYSNTSPQVVAFGVPILNNTYDCGCQKDYVASIDYTRVWSPTLVSDFNVGYFRYNTYRNPAGLGQNPSAALGIASLPINATPSLFLTGNPITAIGGAASFAAPNTLQRNVTNTFPIFGTVTKIWGAHTFRFGASYRDNEFNTYNPAAFPNGNMTFSGTVTGNGVTNVDTALADFESGSVSTAQYESPMPEHGRRNYNFGLFFQDDYKITPKLTVNAGIRYEFESPQADSHNLYSRVNDSNGTLLAAGFNGVSPSLNITTAKLDFSPRIGLAYSPNEKTVIRAAFGTFYGTIFQNLGGQIAYPGFDTTTTFTATSGQALPFSLSQGFPTPFVPAQTNPFLLYNVGTAAAPYNVTGNQFGNLNHLPLVQQWNAGVQQQFPLGFTLEINYVGNHGVHLPSNYPLNIIPLADQDAVAAGGSPTNAAAQNFRPFPGISTYNETSDNGDSHYNALQVTVRRQFNRRLAVLSNYTWAKSIDDASTIYNFSAPSGTANAQFPGVASMRNADRGVSNFDVKHTVNIALVYTTPGPWYTRGWKISPIFSGRTGFPLNIVQNSSTGIGLVNGGNQRPNGDTRNLRVQPYVVGTAIQFLLPASSANFPLTPSGPVYNGTSHTIVVSTASNSPITGGGTVPRDSVRLPGEVDFDVSASKEFPIYRALHFQIRVDAFNVINHTNLLVTSATPGQLTVKFPTPTTANLTGNTTFGQITATEPPRSMQISGRFTF